MAEAVGTIASVVTLFEVCVKAFDFVRKVQQHETDLRRLTIKLGIEHARLYTWGQAVGLAKQSDGGKATVIDQSGFRPLIEDALRLIISLLDDSEKTREKYGCKKISVREDSSKALSRASVFSDTGIFSGFERKWNSVSDKAVWAISDKKKFERLILEARELIDGLQDITRDISSAATQQDMVKSRILHINDIPTLETVAEVCKEDYPDISDAATSHAENLSSIDGHRLTLLDWAQTLDDIAEGSDEDEVTLEDVESMKLTELKQYAISALHHNRRMKLMLEEAVHSNQPSDQPGDPQPASIGETKFEKTARTSSGGSQSLDTTEQFIPSEVLADISKLGESLLTDPARTRDPERFRAIARLLSTILEPPGRAPRHWPGSAGPTSKQAQTFAIRRAVLRKQVDLQDLRKVIDDVEVIAEIEAVKKWLSMLSPSEQLVAFADFFHILDPDEQCGGTVDAGSVTSEEDRSAVR